MHLPSLPHPGPRTHHQGHHPINLVSLKHRFLPPATNTDIKVTLRRFRPRVIHTGRQVGACNELYPASQWTPRPDISRRYITTCDTKRTDQTITTTHTRLTQANKRAAHRPHTSHTSSHDCYRVRYLAHDDTRGGLVIDTVASSPAQRTGAVMHKDGSDGFGRLGWDSKFAPYHKHTYVTGW